MAEVQADNVVSAGHPDPDRRRGGFLGKFERATIKLVRSRWVAMFAVAFAVSWCFHVVEERSDRKIERTQQTVECTLNRVIQAQAQSHRRIAVGPILEACEKQPDK